MKGSADTNNRALEVLGLMRGSGLSLSAASRRVGIAPATVRRRVGTVLIKPGSRWQAKPWDRIPRLVRFLDQGGVREVEVQDSRTAGHLARYWNTVDRFLKTGIDDGLREFRARSFAVRGVRHEFLTDPETLIRLGFAGEVAFEDLYVRD